MSDQGSFTSGDPLGGQQPPSGTDAFGRPAAPQTGYGGGPVPPGAFTPAPTQGVPAGAPLVLAEWWQRAVAAIVDGVVIAIIAAILLLPLGAVGISVDTEGGALALVGAFLVAILVVGIAALVYQPLMLWRTNGQTIGKMTTGIRVVKVDRTPMDITTAIVREVVLKSIALGAVASITFSLAYLVDWLWPLFDAENRALHDFPVNTRVVRA